MTGCGLSVITGHGLTAQEIVRRRANQSSVSRNLHGTIMFSLSLEQLIAL